MNFTGMRFLSLKMRFILYEASHCLIAKEKNDTELQDAHC